MDGLNQVFVVQRMSRGVGSRIAKHIGLVANNPENLHPKPERRAVSRRPAISSGFGEPSHKKQSFGEVARQGGGCAARALSTG